MSILRQERGDVAAAVRASHTGAGLSEDGLLKQSPFYRHTARGSEYCLDPGLDHLCELVPARFTLVDCTCVSRGILALGRPAPLI